MSRSSSSSVFRQPGSPLLWRKKPSRVRELSRRLSARYGDSRLHNKKNPLDELIFIILSAKTSESSYLLTYRALRDKFDNWYDILKSPKGSVAKLIALGGLSAKKEGQIRGVLEEIEKKTGRKDLGFLADVSTAKAEKFLTSLPGVGLKTARCVLMYSEGRRVFPVDTHVKRVLSRLGLIHPQTLTVEVQDSIQRIIPPNVRYKLHVNLVSHGRSTCRARQPLCDACPVSDMCEFYARTSS